MTKGSFYVSIPIVKQFLTKNFPSPVKTGLKNGVFLQKWRSKY